MNNAILSMLIKCLALVEFKEELEDNIETLYNSISECNLQIVQKSNWNSPWGEKLRKWGWFLLALPLCFIFLPIGLVVLILAIIFANKQTKKGTDKNNASIKESEELLERITDRIPIEEANLEEFLESEDWQYVKQNIPPSYIDSTKIQMFIYYFMNGHVTNMQEAVRMYDAYEHQCKMEAYAERTAEINEAMSRDINKIKQEVEWMNLMDYIDRLEKWERANYRSMR